MTPEQPNTPEQMGDSLIHAHKQYSESQPRFNDGKVTTSAEMITKNATQSAIVSAEVALGEAMNTGLAFETSSYMVGKPVFDEIQKRITFWEQTIKYLQSKL